MFRIGVDAVGSDENGRIPEQMDDDEENHKLAGDRHQYLSAHVTV
jgi:hypothetical protein